MGKPKLLPLGFPPPQENAIVSYDSVDFLDGIGIVTYYAGAIKDTSGETYRLDRNIFEPWHQGVSTNGTATTGRNVRSGNLSSSFVKVFDLDFDTTELSQPKTIGGDMLVNIPYGSAITASNVLVTSYVVVTIYYVDTGASEHSIGTTTSPEQTNGDDGVDVNDGMFSFIVSVTERALKIGEKIRINVSFYAKHNGNTDGAVMMCYDPLDRAVAAIDGAGSAGERITQASTTQCKFLVPFKLNQ